MRHVSCIRRILAPSYLSDRDRYEVDILDFIRLTHGRRRALFSINEDDYGTRTLLAVVIRTKNARSAFKDSFLFIYWLEHYETSLKDIIKSKAKQRESITSQSRNSKTILANELWLLTHEANLIAASWKKNNELTSSLNNLQLVTLAESNVACVWRYNVLKDSFDLASRISLEIEEEYKNLQCSWVNNLSTTFEYNFSDRDFIIFYNATCPKSTARILINPDGTLIGNNPETPTSSDVSRKNSEIGISSTKCSDLSIADIDSSCPAYSSSLNDSSRTGVIENNSDANCDTAPRPKNIGFRCRVKRSRVKDKRLHCSYITMTHTNKMFDTTNYRQYYEIYGISGLHSTRSRVAAEYLLGNKELDLSVKIRSLEDVNLCKHTFETGLLTVYASDSLRPTKISKDSVMRASSWITLKSVDLSKKSVENYDEVMGTQLATGLARMIPPCLFEIVNENGINVRLLLSPSDLFLKDKYDNTDNIAGVVVRYIVTVEMPIYIPDSDGGFIYIEDYFINELENNHCINEVKVFKDKFQSLYIILANNGLLSFVAFSRLNPNNIKSRDIDISNRSIHSFDVVKYNNKLFFLIFFFYRPLSEENAQLNGDDSEYILGLYECDNYNLVEIGQYAFCSNNGRSIIQFEKWHDSSSFYLLSNWNLCGTSALDNVKVYILGPNGITKWFEIDNYLHDFLLDDKRELDVTVTSDCKLYGVNLYYTIDKDTFKLPIFDTTANVVPIYHPECIMALVDLGLGVVFNELVIKLVERYRKFLQLLKSTGYCSAGNNGFSECIIYKSLHLKLFTSLNKYFYKFIRKEFKRINDIEVDSENDKTDNTALSGINALDTHLPHTTPYSVPVDELLIYLKAIHLPGISAYDQEKLISLVSYIKTHNDAETSAGDARDTALNFMGCMKSDDPLPKDESTFITAQTASIPHSSCQVSTMGGKLLESGKKEEPTSVYYRDEMIVSLTDKKRVMADELCLNRYMRYASTGAYDEDGIVWALFCSDECDLFQRLNKKAPVKLADFKRLGVGYWVTGVSSIELVCRTLDLSFKPLLSTGDSRLSVESLDEFGFWCIIQNKILLYSHVLKAKGFEKLGSFLMNDFTTERWKQAAIKNAYALISQRRYLLAMAFLVLGGECTDAVDLCVQYLQDHQLSMLMFRILKMDPMYVLNKMEDSLIKRIILFKLNGTPFEMSSGILNVRDLILYIYCGLRYKLVDLNNVANMLRSTALNYLDMGIPIVSLLLSKSVPGSCRMDWDKYFQDSCRYLIKEDINTLHSFNISNDYILPSIDSLIALDLNDYDVKSDDIKIFKPNIEWIDVQYIKVVKLILDIKKELGMNTGMPITDSRRVFYNMHDGIHPNSLFLRLIKLCIGFFDTGLKLDINELLSIIIQLIKSGVELISKHDTTSPLHGIERENYTNWQTQEISAPSFQTFPYYVTDLLEDHIGEDGGFEQENVDYSKPPICNTRKLYSVPMMFIMSLTSLMIIVLNRIDMIEDFYSGIHGQIAVLNEMLDKEDDELVFKQFLVHLVSTIEPTFFTVKHSNVDPDNFNLLIILEDNDPNNIDLHRYFGICITFAILETLIGILRNWIYKNSSG